MDAYRGRTDERCDVWRDAASDQVVEILAERGPLDRIADVALLLERVGLHRRVQRPHRPAFAENLEGHALAQVAHAAAVGDQRFGCPAQHIDEARCDGLAPGVDDLVGLVRRFRREHGGDATGVHGKVDPARIGPAAVVNDAVAYQQFVAWGWRIGQGGRAGSERDDACEQKGQRITTRHGGFPMSGRRAR